MKASPCTLILFLLLMCLQVNLLRGIEELEEPELILLHPLVVEQPNKEHQYESHHYAGQGEPRKEAQMSYDFSSGSTGYSWKTETWNDRMKELITGLVGLINVKGIPVGQFVSILLGLFWPDARSNIWDLSWFQMEYRMQNELRVAEIIQLGSHIKGLQRTMKQYVEAKPNEKGSLMSAIINTCNDLHVRLVHSNNSIHLMPLLVTLSYLHLATLKERLLHGKEIYQEDNSAIWQKDLEEEIETYKKEFKATYAKWQEWRRDSITVMTEANSFTFPLTHTIYSGKIYDKVTYTERSFYSWKSYQPLFSSYPIFKEICDTIKTMLWRRANGAMLQALVPTFFLDNFKPGNEDNPSNPHQDMQTAWFGPFSFNVVEGSSDSRSTVYYPPNDNPTEAAVTQVNVRKSNLIDGLQFFYNGTMGRVYGSTEGGQVYEINSNGRLVHNVKFSFVEDNMAHIEIIFSDGKSSGQFGNPGWLSTEAGGEIDTFGLNNVRVESYNYSGIRQIELKYQHFACRPSEIKLNITEWVMSVRRGLFHA